MGNNSFLPNTVLYFNKLMQQTYVEKSEIIRLKRKFKDLEEFDPTYHKLFNKVTRIANKAKGKNEPSILKTAYETFNTLKNKSLKTEK
jgi:hypothetical protein